MAGNKSQRVQVLRAFFHKGEPLGVDSVLDLPFAQAAELSAAGKVKFVQSDTKLTKTDKPTPRAKVDPTADDPEKEPDDKKGAKK